jgi:hypothetical protein
MRRPDISQRPATHKQDEKRRHSVTDLFAQHHPHHLGAGRSERQFLPIRFCSIALL